MIYGFTSKTFNLSVVPDKMNLISNYHLPDGYALKMMVSFNNGTNWITVLDTLNTINNLGKVLTISNQGSSVILKVEIDVPEDEPDLIFNDQWIEGVVLRDGEPVSGVQIDLCDPETGEVLFWTVSDRDGKYGMEVVPGTYIRKYKGAGFNDPGTKITVGVGSKLFGRDVADVVLADDIGYSKQIFADSVWAGWMILITFKDETLRKSPEDYTNKLICKYGYLYKGQASVDYLTLIMNPEPEVIQ